MCGIFGTVVGPKADFPVDQLDRFLEAQFLLSESRGKEASGLAIRDGGVLSVYKQPLPASTMIRSSSYLEILQNIAGNCNDGHIRPPFAVIGHSRLVTNGKQSCNDNNQPVVRDDIVGIHNGIICNDAELWRQNPQLQRHSDVDTEVMLALVRRYLNEGGDLVEAVRLTLSRIEGAVSTALLFADRPQMLLATNTGSLHYAIVPGAMCLFASEKHILTELLRRRAVSNVMGTPEVVQLAAGRGSIINLETLDFVEFSLEQQGAEPTRRIDVLQKASSVKIVALYAASSTKTPALRRCTRCVLPETFPFITFDSEGVCNLCKSYKKMEVSGAAALEQAIAPFRKSNGQPDCVVAFSGGRDSSYGLHYLKTQLGMNPIAFTYDWGLVTDLARRNQARICGKLGIEHILISADIKKKRRNVRNNIEAWIERPELGMIPLFMAGDKQFFYFANKLRRQTNVDLIVFCVNPLEKTSFKTGFCGVNETSGGMYFNFSLLRKLKLSMYYLKNYLVNPRYLNSSFFDTLWAYWSSFFMSHDYLMLFDYLRWDENEINTTLRSQYNWEIATDTNSTWRIGDGTAAFYNYIYQTVCGFTENDTFRSNQIREGVITRQEALRLIEDENKPRWESMRWYADTIGFNLDEVLTVIQAMPKLQPAAAPLAFTESRLQKAA